MMVTRFRKSIFSTVEIMTTKNVPEDVADFDEDDLDDLDDGDCDDLDDDDCDCYFFERLR